MTDLAQVKGKGQLKKRTKHPLDHPKKALVYTQVYLSPEPITTKSIAENTGLALNTVYTYIRELASEEVICSRSVQIGNLVQEQWFIKPEYFEKRREQNKVVFNDVYDDYFLAEPKQMERQLTLLRSMAIPYMKAYEQDQESFKRMQENHPRPALIKLWVLDPEEYEYVVGEIEKIRKKLREANIKMKEKRNHKVASLTVKGENNLIFMVALPAVDSPQH
ncbi:MAG: hypothetical protein ACFFD4_22975 [Candidatus Odinarchaeota archaeon]